MKWGIVTKQKKRTELFAFSLVCTPAGGRTYTDYHLVTDILILFGSGIKNLQVTIFKWYKTYRCMIFLLFYSASIR